MNQHNVISARRRTVPALILAAVCAGLPTPQHAAAAPGFDLLLFPHIQLQAVRGAPAGTDDDDLGAGVSIFASITHGRLLALAEYFWDDREHEFERLQAGIRAGSANSLWFGRVHSPLGYWATAHHHGPYLQTSVSRPAAANFEDDGGIFPLHIVGLNVEGRHDTDAGTFEYVFVAGDGPGWSGGVLEAMNIAEPSDGEHDTAGAFRLSWQPDESELTAGLFFGVAKIPGDQVNVAGIRQRLAGAYLQYGPAPWQFLAEGFVSGNDVTAAGAVSSGQFHGGYLQAEYTTSPGVTIFARAEGTGQADRDSYLALFPDFVHRRALSGLRWDFARRHALSAEVAHLRKLAGSESSLVVQWSMVFP